MVGLMDSTYHDLYTNLYGAAMTLTLGIDVSKYQGTVDWAAVGRTPYRFALTRMSIGRGTTDPTGRRNLSAMLNQMPIAGGYGVVGVSEPVEDGAKLLLDEIAAVVDPHKVLVMLDAENFADGSHPTIGQVDRYAIAIHDQLGRWPIAYVPGWWLSQHNYTVVGRGLANCPWAQSHYLPAPWGETKLLASKPTDLKGFKTLAWLQYTSSATVSGVAGVVDANCFYGTVAELRTRLLGQKEADLSAAEIADLKAYVDVRTDALHHDIAIAIHGGDPDPEPGRNSLDSLAAAVEVLEGKVDQIIANLTQTPA